MKEAIQLRREHLICYKQQDHFKEVDFDTSTANFDTRNVHLALDGQHEDYTEVLKFQQTFLNIKDGASTLGLLWHPATDQLQVKDNSTSTSKNSTASTKCNESARLASNLIHWGLLSPTVIAHKTLIQKLWQDNLLWDEQLQQEDI